MFFFSLGALQGVMTLAGREEMLGVVLLLPQNRKQGFLVQPVAVGHVRLLNVPAESISHPNFFKD